MKRKIALISLLFMTILFILSNGFFETIYHVNLFDYFFNSNELTEEDREYLREYGPIIYASDNNSPPYAIMIKRINNIVGSLLIIYKR